MFAGASYRQSFKTEGTSSKREFNRAFHQQLGALIAVEPVIPIVIASLTPFIYYARYIGFGWCGKDAICNGRKVSLLKKNSYVEIGESYFLNVYVRRINCVRNVPGRIVHF